MKVIVDTNKIKEETLQQLMKDYNVTCVDDLRGEYLDSIIIDYTGMEYGLIEWILRTQGEEGIPGWWGDNYKEILEEQIDNLIWK